MSDIIIFIFIWGVWILIPIIIDGAETMVRIAVVVYSQFRRPEKPMNIKDKELPNISVVIPAYNEEKIINRCIASIKIQDYPQEKVDIVVIDDGSTDSTVKRIINYAAGRNGNGNGHKNGHANGYSNGTVKINGAQYEVPDFQGGLKLLASDYHLGKPEALNTAIESSNGHGDLIITVDSDVVLSPHTLRETAKSFMAKPKMGAATGNIEISWQNMVKIDEDGNPVFDKDGHIVNRKLSFWENILAKCQFLEYLDSFRLGREFQSRVHSTYILAGAYSAFRKDVLRQIYYRDATLTEDFDLTVDIHRLGSYIGYVPKAKAYLEPVVDWDHLYSQRVRWHRGQMEVSALHKEMIGNREYGKMGWFGFPQMLLGDHTLSFPRLIWTPLILFFGLFGYPYQTIFMAVLFMYLFYVGITILQTTTAYFYVDKETREHVQDLFSYCFIMPFYRLATFYFRMSGFLTVLKEPPRWQVAGPVSGIKNSVNGFKNGIKNGVNGVKNGNGNGNGHHNDKGKNGKNGNGKNGKNGNGVTNGYYNGINGVKNGAHILKHGLSGLKEAIKKNRKKKHVYNNDVSHKDGLKKKDVSSIGLIYDDPDTPPLKKMPPQKKSYLRKQIAKSSFLSKMLPFVKKSNGNGNGDLSDLRAAFPRRRPPESPYKILLSPRNVESCVSEAYYYLNKSRFKDALIPYDEAVDYVSNSNDLVLLYLETAKSLFLAGQYEEAWPNFKKAEILTNDPAIKNEIKATYQRFPEKYREPDLDSLVKQAYSNLEKGQIIPARDFFRQAIEQSNKASDISMLRLEIAKTYYQSGEIKSAYRDFRDAYLIAKKIKTNTEEFEALEKTAFSKVETTTIEELNILADKALKNKDYAEARELFKNALALATDLKQIVYLELAVAKTYLSTNRYEQAKEHLIRVKAISPQSIVDPGYRFVEERLPLEYRQKMFDDLIVQGYGYLNEGSYAKARSFFRQAIESSNDIGSLTIGYLELGRLFYHGGQKRKARLNLNNALILSRSNGSEELPQQIESILKDLPKPYVKDAVTSVAKESYDFIDKGQFGKARTAIKKGFALAEGLDDLVVLRTELGKTYGYAKRFKKATKELSEALIMAESLGDHELEQEIRALLVQFPSDAPLSYDSFLAKGYEFIAKKKYKKAQKAFKESLNLAKDKDELLLSHLEIAKTLISAKKNDEAVERLTYTLNLSKTLALSKPKQKEVEALLSSLKNEKRSQKFKKAADKAYEHILKRDFQKARGFISQGFALADDIESIIQLRIYIGNLYAFSGQHKRASNELKIALFLSQKIENKSFEREIKDVLAFMPRSLENFEALLNRGQTLHKEGKNRLAYRAFKKTVAAAQTPKQLLRLYLAQGRSRLGGHDDKHAKRDLRKALILSGEYDQSEIEQQINELMEDSLAAS